MQVKVLLVSIIAGTVSASLRGDVVQRILQDTSATCVESAPEPTCSSIGPKCTPYRSPDFCGDAISFPSLISSRKQYVDANQAALKAEGWWFQSIDDKIAGYVYSASAGYNPPKLYYCSINVMGGLDEFSTSAQASNGGGFVIRATHLHSTKGIYVLPAGFGGVELIRNVPYNLGDVKMDLQSNGATKIVIEEYIPGTDQKLPVEYKFHVFPDGTIGSINIFYGRGTLCNCWAEIDTSMNRLDQYGCFTPGGSEMMSGQCNTIDFITGATKAFPIKGVDLCSSIPPIDDEVFSDMQSIASRIGREVGVYMRVDMFYGADGAVHVQEFSSNHLNGLRHCSAKLLDNGCIDSCFLGKLWDESASNKQLGGSRTPIPSGLSTFLDIASEEAQCTAAVSLDLAPRPVDFATTCPEAIPVQGNECLFSADLTCPYARQCCDDTEARCVDSTICVCSGGTVECTFQTLDCSSPSDAPNQVVTPTFPFQVPSPGLDLLPTPSPVTSTDAPAVPTQGTSSSGESSPSPIDSSGSMPTVTPAPDSAGSPTEGTTPAPADDTGSTPTMTASPDSAGNPSQGAMPTDAPDPASAPSTPTQGAIPTITDAPDSAGNPSQGAMPTDAPDSASSPSSPTQGAIPTMTDAPDSVGTPTQETAPIPVTNTGSTPARTAAPDSVDTPSQGATPTDTPELANTLIPNITPTEAPVDPSPVSVAPSVFTATTQEPIFISQAPSAPSGLLPPITDECPGIIPIQGAACTLPIGKSCGYDEICCPDTTSCVNTTVFSCSQERIYVFREILISCDGENFVSTSPSIVPKKVMQTPNSPDCPLEEPERRSQCTFPFQIGCGYGEEYCCMNNDAMSCTYSIICFCVGGETICQNLPPPDCEDIPPTAAPTASPSSLSSSAPPVTATITGPPSRASSSPSVLEVASSAPSIALTSSPSNTSSTTPSLSTPPPVDATSASPSSATSSPSVKEVASSLSPSVAVTPPPSITSSASPSLSQVVASAAPSITPEKVMQTPNSPDCPLEEPERRSQCTFPFQIGCGYGEEYCCMNNDAMSCTYSIICFCVGGETICQNLPPPDCEDIPPTAAPTASPSSLSSSAPPVTATITGPPSRASSSPSVLEVASSAPSIALTSSPSNTSSATPSLSTPPPVDATSASPSSATSSPSVKEVASSLSPSVAVTPPPSITSSASPSLSQVVASAAPSITPEKVMQTPNSPDCPLEEPERRSQCTFPFQIGCGYGEEYCCMNNDAMSCTYSIICFCVGGETICQNLPPPDCEDIPPTAAPTASPSSLSSSAPSLSTPPPMKAATGSPSSSALKPSMQSASPSDLLTTSRPSVEVVASSAPVPDSSFTDECPVEKPNSGDTCTLPLSKVCFYVTACCPGSTTECSENGYVCGEDRRFRVDTFVDNICFFQGPANATVTPVPTPAPTLVPTPAVTLGPTPAPTLLPIGAPLLGPTPAPTLVPTTAVTLGPTPAPTLVPTGAPLLGSTPAPTLVPTTAVTLRPTPAPKLVPTAAPTLGSTPAPTLVPTTAVTLRPTLVPTAAPTLGSTPAPTLVPTTAPTLRPTSAPTLVPTTAPTLGSTPGPTVVPTTAPTLRPTSAPTLVPTAAATLRPTSAPTLVPTTAVTIRPTPAPTLGSAPAPTPMTVVPSSSSRPSTSPIGLPSNLPSTIIVNDLPVSLPSFSPTEQRSISSSTPTSVASLVTTTTKSNPMECPAIKPNNGDFCPAGIVCDYDPKCCEGLASCVDTTMCTCTPSSLFICTTLGFDCPPLLPGGILQGAPDLTSLVGDGTSSCPLSTPTFGDTCTPDAVGCAYDEHCCPGTTNCVNTTLCSCEGELGFVCAVSDVWCGDPEGDVGALAPRVKPWPLETMSLQETGSDQFLSVEATQCPPTKPAKGDACTYLAGKCGYNEYCCPGTDNCFFTTRCTCDGDAGYVCDNADVWCDPDAATTAESTLGGPTKKSALRGKSLGGGV